MDEWTLCNDEKDDVVKVVPTAGAVIRFVRLKGKIIMSGPAAKLSENKGYHGAVLFPWGNRIKDGGYTFNNESYQLRINDLAHHHAIHGFVADQPFTVTDRRDGVKSCQITMQYTYGGSTVGYPFPFVLQLKITLSGNSEVMLDFNVQNTGKTSLPFVLGWHPYFQFGGETVEDWEIRFPGKLKYHLDERNLPVFSTEISGLKKSVLPIGTKYLNEGFLLHAPDNNIAITELSSKKSMYTIQVWQRTGKQQLNYLVIYTPADRKSIAIEPMSGAINAFNSGDGLISLLPSEDASFSTGIKLINRPG